MSSILESFQKPSFFPSRSINDSLPVSHNHQSTDCSKQQKEGNNNSIRRRLSSISLRIQPSNITSSAASASSMLWGFRRSKSESSIQGESTGTNSIRKWWEWGWGWILSRKPTFARDLEMNEEETSMLGCHSKGSWRHVMFKLRAELRRLVIGSTHVNSATKTPPVFSYDSYSYAHNFDDGNTRHG